MNFINNFANYYYQTTTTSSSDLAPAAIAVVFSTLLISILASYVISAWLIGRIFKKAHTPQWIAWVPFYNTWKMLELGGQQGFWAVLAIIPVVNIVSAIFLYIAMYHIGLKLGKSGAFVLWAIFIPIVWYVWLAFDNSTWQNTAPSGTPVPQPPLIS